jgi:hypothetical protein
MSSDANDSPRILSRVASAKKQPEIWNCGALWVTSTHTWRASGERLDAGHQTISIQPP